MKYHPFSRQIERFSTGVRKLLERMETIPKTNPDAECRTAAEKANARLTAAGLKKK